jgi:hypothetical protein
MINRRLIFGPLLLGALYAAGAEAAQVNDDWSVDAEVRLRFESMDGFNDKQYGDNVTTGKSKDNYLLSRIRLGTTYRLNPDLLVKVSFQDARIVDWGFEDAQWYNKEFGLIHNPMEDQLELYHTYLQASNLGGVPLTLTLGRQRIAYGDKRVFGPGEWKNSGKWIWDAAKASYKTGEHFVDIFIGKTMLHDPDTFSLDHRWGYTGAGLYGHYAWEKGAFEPILAYKHNDDGEQKYEELTHYYAGFRLYDDNLRNFFYNATLMQQWGEQTKLGGTEVDVDAMGWHVDAGYKLSNNFGNAKFGIGYTYATGDDAGTSDVETFDAVFGASDKYYGRMNLMKWSNLKDTELFASFSPMKKVKVKAEYHRFEVEDEAAKWRIYKNPAGSDETHLGDEFDIVAKYGFSKSLAFQAGYAHFWPGDFIEQNVPSDSDADWFFLQSTFKF